MSESAPAKKKAFGLMSMVLFSVSAILVGDTIASSAALGVSGLTLWIGLGILFFIPYGLVTAELGSAWPEEGGIYVWVREAFGPMWGTVTAWLYWVNVALWAPSVFVLFMYTLEAAFGITLPLWGQAAAVIVLIWIMVAIGVLPMHYSKWVPNASAAVKIVVFVVLGLAGIAYVAKTGTIANSFELKEWVPSFSFDNLTYLPVVIYSLMGFELMSSVGEGAIQDPKKDIPKMIFAAGGAILFVYMFATFGVLAAIPVADIQIETGIVDALKPAFEAVLGDAAGPAFAIMALGVLFTFLGNMVTWSIGANESLAATGMDETAPGLFGHKNKNGAPDYAFYLMGAIATVLTILTYALFGNNDGIFWAIFTVSSVVFLLPYLLMFPSIVILRKKFPNQPRPYTVPGGDAGAMLWAVLCEIGIAFTLALFFIAPPEGTPMVAFYMITVGGTLLSVAVGFWLYFHARKSSLKDGKTVELSA